MSIEATADALVAETATPIEAPQTPVEDDLGAVFDRLNAEPDEQPDEAPEQAAEQPPEADEGEPEVDGAEDEGEAAEEAFELPGNLPQSLREQLAKMPKAAVDAVLTDRDDMHRKLSDMGRQVHGISPIRDVLIEATKHYPHLSDMKPEQVGKELLQMAEVGDRLARDPVGTLLETAKRHNVLDQLGQRLSGQPAQQGGNATVQMQNHIKQLERKVAQLTDPEYLQNQVTQITSTQSVQNEVQQFSQTADHWADVEPHIPAYIPIAQAKLGDGAAPGAVLKLAYEKAIQDWKPEAAQAPKPEAVTDPQTVADPERTKAAVKAKSVNVTGKSTGKPRVLSEMEELAAIYDKTRKS